MAGEHLLAGRAHTRLARQAFVHQPVMVLVYCTDTHMYPSACRKWHRCLSLSHFQHADGKGETSVLAARCPEPHKLGKPDAYPMTMPHSCEGTAQSRFPAVGFGLACVCSMCIGGAGTDLSFFPLCRRMHTDMRAVLGYLGPVGLNALLSGRVPEYDATFLLACAVSLFPCFRRLNVAGMKLEAKRPMYPHEIKA